MMANPTLTQAPAPILVLGPAHSGKSGLAPQLLSPEEPATVLGTAPGEEPAFATRLAALRARRPASWESLDAGPDLAAALAEALGRTRQVLVDSVSQWLAALVVGEAGTDEEALALALNQRVEELARLVAAHPRSRVVLVSAEVGAAPAPLRPAERTYRQAVGLANQRLGELCATVLLVHAGIPLTIKGR